MRVLLLIVFVALAGLASAEEKPKKPVSVIKEVDKATPVLMQAQADDEDTDNVPQTRARDHNSSRSNTTSLIAPAKARDYNSSRSNNESTKAASIDYNSSRSNNVNGAASDDDQDKPVRCKEGECKSE